MRPPLRLPRWQSAKVQAGLREWQARDYFFPLGATLTRAMLSCLRRPGQASTQRETAARGYDQGASDMGYDPSYLPAPSTERSTNRPICGTITTTPPRRHEGRTENIMKNRHRKPYIFIPCTWALPLSANFPIPVGFGVRTSPGNEPGGPAWACGCVTGYRRERLSISSASSIGGTLCAGTIAATPRRLCTTRGRMLVGVCKAPSHANQSLRPDVPFDFLTK